MKVIKNIAMRHCDDRVIAVVDFDKRGPNDTAHAIFEQMYDQFYGNTATLDAQIAIMDEIRDFAKDGS